MGVENSNELGIQRSSTSLMNIQFSELYQNPAPEPLMVTDWSPHCDFGGTFALFGSSSVESDAARSSSVAMPEQITCFAGGGFSQPIASLEKDSTFRRRKSVPTASNSPPNMTQPKEETSPNSPRNQESNKNEKRQRIEQNQPDGSRKQSAKQSKDGEEGKEDYIHVRAKRGQATNSHSLAERVRRERISERMRFLQNLVPGCNKITGKAVMLDEIINYVQSLQRQVEFLSMKLATVNPELNLEIVQLLSRDVLHSGGGCSASLGFGPAGLNPSLCHTNGFLSQAAIPSEVFCHAGSNPQEMMPSNISPIPQLQANAWDEELHNAIQAGFLYPFPKNHRNAEPPGNQE